MTTHKPILCLDFDGVCHSYMSGWTNAWTIPDPPVDGLFEFIVAALKVFRVVIHSSRSESAEGRRAMQKWFMDEATKYYEDKEIASLLVIQIEFPIYKPAAKVTLDDRAVTFTGYFPDVTLLANFEPWNKEMKNG